MLIRKAKVKYYGALLYKFKGDVSKTWRVLKLVIGKMSDMTGVYNILAQAFVPIVQMLDVIWHLKFPIQRNHEQLT